MNILKDIINKVKERKNKIMLSIEPDKFGIRQFVKTTAGEWIPNKDWEYTTKLKELAKHINIPVSVDLRHYVWVSSQKKLIVTVTDDVSELESSVRGGDYLLLMPKSSSTAKRVQFFIEYLTRIQPSDGYALNTIIGTALYDDIIDYLHNAYN